MNGNVLQLKKEYKEQEIQSQRINFYATQSTQPTIDMAEIKGQNVISLSHRQLAKQRIKQIQDEEMEGQSTQRISLWDKCLKKTLEKQEDSENQNDDKSSNPKVSKFKKFYEKMQKEKLKKILDANHSMEREKIKRAKVFQQGTNRRKKALLFKDLDTQNQIQDVTKIKQNLKALNSMDNNDMKSLAKVIENSIVFTLSKQGRFSKFKANDKDNINQQKRERKFMIDMGQAEYAREFGSESRISEHDLCDKTQSSAIINNAMSIQEGKSRSNNPSPIVSPRSSIMSNDKKSQLTVKISPRASNVSKNDLLSAMNSSFSNALSPKSPKWSHRYRPQVQEVKPLPPSPRLEGLDKKEETLDIQDQYIKNIKFGISQIDTNLPLKKFIVKQNDRKFIQTDQTKKDIKMYMENLCNQKASDEQQHTQQTLEDADSDIETAQKEKQTLEQMLDSSDKKVKVNPRFKPRTNKQLKLLDEEDRFKRAPMLDEIHEAQKIMRKLTINKETSNAGTVGWSKCCRGTKDSETKKEYQGNPMSQADMSRHHVPSKLDVKNIKISEKSMLETKAGTKKIIIEQSSGQFTTKGSKQFRGQNIPLQTKQNKYIADKMPVMMSRKCGDKQCDQSTSAQNYQRLQLPTTPTLLSTNHLNPNEGSFIEQIPLTLSLLSQSQLQTNFESNVNTFSPRQIQMSGAGENRAIDRNKTVNFSQRFEPKSTNYSRVTLKSHMNIQQNKDIRSGGTVSFREQVEQNDTTIGTGMFMLDEKITTLEQINLSGPIREIREKNPSKQSSSFIMKPTKDKMANSIHYKQIERIFSSLENEERNTKKNWSKFRKLAKKTRKANQIFEEFIVEQQAKK